MRSNEIACNFPTAISSYFSSDFFVSKETVSYIFQLHSQLDGGLKLFVTGPALHVREILGSVRW